MNDEFDESTLDNKWTVTLGAPGTVNLLASSCSTAIYDLASVPGYLATQCEGGSNNKMYMRQDYTLPDGKSVILKLLPTINSSGNLDAEVFVGMVLNNDDSTPLTVGNSGYMLMEFRANNDGWRIYAGYCNTNNTIDATAIGEDGDESPMNGNLMYFRIARHNNTYSFFTSFSGVSWIPMKLPITPSAIFTNIWLRNRSDISTGSKALPVHLIEWIHEVDNTVFNVET
jgi:hypothetical protein